MSNGEKCWRHSNGTYWPELLSQDSDLSSLGIYVYTYQTGLGSGSYGLSSIVDDLKEHIFTLDGVAKSKRIVFVCHSMGGIVVRRLIVERENDFKAHGIEISLYLVASPSLGSNYANWLEPIARFAGHEQAKALTFSQSNQWLNDLDKTFINLKESKRLTLHGKELLEDKFITLPGLIRKQVVEPFSGTRYFGESYKVPNSNHFSIAKPENNSSIQHRLLKAFILDMNLTKQDFSELNSKSSNNPLQQTIKEIEKLYTQARYDDAYEQFCQLCEAYPDYQYQAATILARYSDFQTNVALGVIPFNKQNTAKLQIAAAFQMCMKQFKKEYVSDD